MEDSLTSFRQQWLQELSGQNSSSDHQSKSVDDDLHGRGDRHLKACFSNEFSTFSHKMVYTHVIQGELPTRQLVVH